jgi:iron complex transport system ATP-binding protein
VSAILQAKGVTIRAGRNLLLDDVTLNVNAGERLAIVGPNGAGKTTLLRVLSGELKPQDGIVLLKGRDVAGYAARDLSLHRAVLSQHVNVAFPFTAREIVAMGAGNVSGRWLDRMVEEKLAALDMLKFAGRDITTLSGGEQQRVHMARVLVQLACGKPEDKPGVLLLDEPTSSLDLRHQLGLFAIAAEAAAQGAAVVTILHDLNFASVFADRIVVMANGCIAADGAPAETITEEMLGRVFRVAGGIGSVASSPLPSVLPHRMSSLPD